MKLKKNRRAKLQKKITSEKPTEGDSPLRELYKFQDTLYTLRSSGMRSNEARYRKEVRQIYHDVFDEMPPSDIATVLVRFKIAYELMHRGYKRTKLSMPETLVNRYECSKHFKTTSFPQSLQSLIDLQARAEAKEGGDMAKVKKKIGKKVSTKKKKGSVTEFYQSLLESNYRAKLSDVKLAAALNRQFPDSAKADGYSAADVKKVRSLFNCGSLSTQGGKKPKLTLGEFGAKKLAPETKKVKKKKFKKKKKK